MLNVRKWKNFAQENLSVLISESTRLKKNTGTNNLYNLIDELLKYLVVETNANFFHISCAINLSNNPYI